MTTIDWPNALIPQDAQLVLRKSGRQFTSPFNGSTQATDDVAERWALSVTLPARALSSGSGLQAFCGMLAGGVNRVRAWHFGSRGTPQGTLRGVPTLAASAVRGDASISLSNCQPGGVKLREDFDIDSDANGISNGWSAWSAGSVTTPFFGRGGGPWSNQQYANAASMGGAAALGVSLDAAIGVVAGSQYTITAQLYSYRSTHRIEVAFYNSGGSVIGSSVQGNWAGTGLGYDQRSITATAPAGAVSMRLWIYMHTATGTSPEIRIDQVQVDDGAAIQPFAQPAATLLADDMIGLGGHLLQVADNCTAVGGAMTVPLVNRIRGPIASGAVVTWYRPTAVFILPAMQAGPVWQPGGIMQATALDLVEVYTP